MRSSVIIIGLFCFLFQGAKAQQSLDDINLQVKFVNESIHGIMVANKLFELFNQDVNRYVDVDSYQLQGFNNADLPKNLFDQSSRDYYEEKTPVEYFNEISSRKSINQKNKVLATQLYATINDIDKMRFDIAGYLDLNDLSDYENLPGIYALLEKCVFLYKNFYVQYKDYSQLLNENYQEISSQTIDGGSVYSTFSDMHQNVIKCMAAIRNHNDSAANQYLKNFSLMYLRFKKEIESNPGVFADLRGNPNSNKKIEAWISSVRDFVEENPVSTSYTDYGLHYYTHNKTAISKTNKYGNGFIQEMNLTMMANQVPAMLFLQVPHYFKVIYPKKLDIIQQISSSNKFLPSIPSIVNDRKVKENSITIRTKTKVLELELFDHLVQDGDLVSLNFNGDWILENYSLEKKSKKLRFELNPNGKNYLILFAASIGQRPPNTMAVKYMNEKEEEVQIILRSDLKVSEVIELKYVPN